MESVNFQAIVASVKTLVDGSIRISLDLSEDSILQAAQLMECKRVGIVLRITAIPEKQVKNRGQTRDMESGPERKSAWSPVEITGTD